MLDPVFGYQITLGAALLLAVAGAHKLSHPSGFAQVVAAYRLLPDAWPPTVAAGIPCIELALAAGLLCTATRGACVIAAAGLLACYSLGLAVNLARGRRELDCGCGPLHKRRGIAAWMLWRNGILIALLAVACLPWGPRALTGIDAASIGAGLAAAASVYAALDLLLGDILPRGAAIRRVS